MRLNKEDKHQLLCHIEMTILGAKELPDASVHLEKELLEELIFMKKIVWVGGKPVEIKFPAYTGAFLQKIDLSEVSFDSVVWNKKDFCEIAGIPYKSAGDYDCDLSYTNAKIDFSKAIDMHKFSLEPDKSYGYIQRINFAGADLANSHIEEIYGAEYTSFEDALGDFSSIFDQHKHFKTCNFDNVSINHGPILVREFYDNFDNCNFSNTGIDIIYDPKREGLEVGQVLSDHIHLGYFCHCLINHVQIHSSKEASAMADQKAKEYTAYQKKLYSIVDKAIKNGSSQEKKS